MPRLMILLLVVLVMAAVAVQNPEPLSLVVLGGFKTPEIPLGLMLIGAAASGSLITLVLYGLVGLRRPPESKYRPMGQRVPYPNSPGTTTLPPSGPTYSPEEAPDRSTSTAFVSEPAVSQSPASDSPAEEIRSQDATPYGSSYPAEENNATYDRAFSSPDATASDVVVPETAPDASSASRPAIRNPFAQKKKNKGKRETPVENKRVGDNWGDLRTAEQLNSWEAIGEAAKTTSQDAGRQSGFFDSIASGIGLGGRSPQAAGQIADDIAAGWDENSPRPDGYSSAGYDSNSYGPESYGPESYGDRDDDGLDSGWESSDNRFDSDERAPFAEGSQEQPQKRVYDDGLYGDEGPYADSDSLEEIGPEGVYEADYRVIEPPSKPLADPSAGQSDNDDYPA